MPWSIHQTPRRPLMRLLVPVLRCLVTALPLSALALRGAEAARVEAAGVKSVGLEFAVTGKAGFTLLTPQETGLTFTNHLSEWASAENRVLNNGSGVAAGDYDNDGNVDLFFSSLNHGNKLFRNLGQWRFEDVTEKSGLKFPRAYYRGAVFA